MCLQGRHGEQTREMHRYDLTRFVFIAPSFFKPSNKGNRNTEYMLFVLSHYCYLHSSRRSLHRYGTQNSQNVSLKPGNKEDIILLVLLVIYISIVLPVLSSIV